MRKLWDRLRAIWNAPDVVTGVIDATIDQRKRLAQRIDVLTEAVSENVAQALRDRNAVDADVAALNGRCQSLEKQLADLRAIVANLREEAKRPPVSARNIGHLRSFVAQTGEEE